MIDEKIDLTIAGKCLIFDGWTFKGFEGELDGFPDESCRKVFKKGDRCLSIWETRGPWGPNSQITSVSIQKVHFNGITHQYMGDEYTASIISQFRSVMMLFL